MPPVSILAKPVADAVLADVGIRVERFLQKQGRPPKLVVVLVGDDPASTIYTRKKGELARQMGMGSQILRLPASATPDEVKSVIKTLNEDENVDGILIQRPLPKSFLESEVLYWVSPSKDVDAFHPENAGRMFLGLSSFKPCTPAGVMELLRYYKIDVAGKLACIIGRSSIVGKPMAALLLQADATVITTHSRTRDLATLSRQADLVIAAIGKPEFLTAQHVRPGAVVIDVGINRRTDGKLVGDVAYNEVAPLASAITPVPGGVGPMTIAILLQNTLLAAEMRQV